MWERAGGTEPLLVLRPRTCHNRSVSWDCTWHSTCSWQSRQEQRDERGVWGGGGWQREREWRLELSEWRTTGWWEKAGVMGCEVEDLGRQWERPSACQHKTDFSLSSASVNCLFWSVIRTHRHSSQTRQINKAIPVYHLNMMTRWEYVVITASADVFWSFIPGLWTDLNF